MISTGVRRDLQNPLRYFSRIDIAHCYRYAFDDLTPSELTGTVHYRNPVDLYHKLVKCAPDIIQGVEPFGLFTLPYILTGWLYATRYSVPLVVVSLENRPITIKYGRFGGTILQHLLAPYFRRASLLIYLNDGTKKNFDYCRAPKDRLKRLMYGTWGVDTAEFSPDGPVHHHPYYERYILFVGRIIRAKGVFELVDAFVPVVRRFEDVGLLFVGDGEDRPALEQHAYSLGLEQKVEFLGTILNQELPPYFRGSSIFVSPSRTTRTWEEQVGMTNIQAMACGTPVVSTLSGAIPEYVENGKTGVLIPEQDTEQLSHALMELLTNKRLVEGLSTSARSHALAHYDAAQNIQRIEEYLLQVARQSPRYLARAAGHPTLASEN